MGLRVGDNRSGEGQGEEVRSLEDERRDVEKLLRAKKIYPLKRDKTSKTIARMMKEAPSSLATHARLIHRDDDGRRIVAARHHREWVRIMEDVKGHRWVVVVAPPGYAKTTWFSQILPTWRLGVTGGALRLGIISRTSTQAMLLANAIRESTESTWFRMTYPECIPDYERGWTQTKFFFTNTPEGPNPAVGAFGIQSRQIQGRRFDEIVVDDPVNEEDVRSEEQMEKIKKWFKSMLIQRFPPGKGPPGDEGRMTVVLTRWGERDLIPMFEDLGFKIVTMPALGYWDRVEDTETGHIEYGDEPLWAAKETAEELLLEREKDEYTFELVMQGNVKVTLGDMFDRSWFKRGVPPSIDQFDQIVQYVDTAGGKDRKKGDYFALATLGSVKNGEEIWVLDMVRHRKAAPEQERSVFTEYERWKDYGHAPDLIIIEDANEGRALYQRLVVSTRLPLKSYSPTKDKAWRAIPLSNAYRAGRVWHPEGEAWVPAYENELVPFPDGVHDDQVDAAGGAFNQMATDAGMKIRVLS